MFLTGVFTPSLSAQMQVLVEPVLLASMMEELPLSGSVFSPRASKLAPQESGLVLHVKVDEGDRVEAGDVLLELDSELAGLELTRLKAQLQEAKLLLEDASRLADEGRRLIDDKNISKSEFDSRLVREATADQGLQQLDAQIEMQSIRVSRHFLRAPFAGVIADKQTEVGEWLMAGNTAFNLVQMDPLRVQARIPERYYRQIQSGTRVAIEMDALPDQVLKASVDGVIPVSDNTTRSFTARMDIPNPGFKLAPGMSARLVFSLGDSTATEVFQVPADAIVRRGDGSTQIWVVRDQQAIALPVNTGRRNNGLVEVGSPGLLEGDLVVVLGNESLVAGQNVIAVRK